MPTYKVVQQKTNSFMTGRMTAEQLESRINEWAGQGWTLDRIPPPIWPSCRPGRNPSFRRR